MAENGKEAMKGQILKGIFQKSENRMSKDLFLWGWRTTSSMKSANTMVGHTLSEKGEQYLKDNNMSFEDLAEILRPFIQLFEPPHVLMLPSLKKQYDLGDFPAWKVTKRKVKKIVKKIENPITRSIAAAKELFADKQL